MNAEQIFREMEQTFADMKAALPLHPLRWWRCRREMDRLSAEHLDALEQIFREYRGES